MFDCIVSDAENDSEQYTGSIHITTFVQYIIPLLVRPKYNIHNIRERVGSIDAKGKL